MKTRVGLIGCGIVSGSHIAAFRAIPDTAQIVAVADCEPDRARAAAEKAGAPRIRADYRELLSASDVDAVDICLPHHLHRVVSIAALEAGKHVLCEKPIANTLADADAMTVAAQRSGRVLMIAETSRFLPEVTRAAQLLQEGAIGEPILAQSVYAWYQDGAYLKTPWRFDPGQMGGGALIDGGIHYVDMLLTLMGRPVSVSCFTTRVRDIFPAEDTAVVIARFESGALGELSSAWSAPHMPSMRFRISGRQGTLTARHGQIEVASDRLGQSPTVYDVDPVNPFDLEIAHFVECVQSGAKPLIGGVEARADLEFVLAAYESARTGRHVALPLSGQRT